MNVMTRPAASLTTGLCIFAITMAVFLGLTGLALRAVSIDRAAPSRLVNQTLPKTGSAGTEAFLQSLQAFDAAAARRLFDDRDQYISPDQRPIRRYRTLQTAIQALSDAAIHMPNIESADYQRILNKVEHGLGLLSASKSDWCSAPRIARLVRLNDTDVLPAAIAVFAADPVGYDWLLDWTATILEAATKARRKPVFHGRRTARDKLLVQQAGRRLAADDWMLAVSIANFSYAEGQSYAAMQNAVQGINVCEAGQAFVMLSRNLPSQVNNRVLAELLPAVFSGRVDYALYLIRNYFFID